MEKLDIINNQKDKNTFLNEYWNKKPYLFKNFLSDTQEFAQASDFLDMAMDEDFETRLVLEDCGDYPWQLKHGPLATKDIPAKNKKWTLICHGLNLYSPEFFELEQMMRFIANWKFDDVMATYSMPGASVGAHIDNYSVFILQGSGSRKWLLETNPNKAFKENIDIKQLKKFTPNIEWTLEAGDMIYIPPHVAHHGVTLAESISYSIGFKAIEMDKVLDLYATEYMSNWEGEYFYQEKEMKETSSPFVLTSKESQDIFEQFKESILKQACFEKSLAKFLTRPRLHLESDESISENELEDEALFQRSMHSKMLAIPTDHGSYNVIIFDVELYDVEMDLFKKLELIYASESCTEFQVGMFSSKERLQLLPLFQSGHFLLV